MLFYRIESYFGCSCVKIYSALEEWRGESFFVSSLLWGYFWPPKTIPAAANSTLQYVGALLDHAFPQIILPQIILHATLQFKGKIQTLNVVWHGNCDHFSTSKDDAEDRPSRVRPRFFDQVGHQTTKVRILWQSHFGKMKLWPVEHFYNTFFLTFGCDCWIQ